MKKLTPLLMVILLQHTTNSVVVTGKEDPVFTHSGHNDTLSGHLIYATDPLHPFAKTHLFIWHPKKSTASSFTYRGAIGQATEQDDQLIAQGLWVYVSGYDVTTSTITNKKKVQIVGALILGTNKIKAIDTLFEWERIRRTKNKL